MFNARRSLSSLGWSAVALVGLTLGACAAPSHSTAYRPHTTSHDAEVAAMARQLVPLKVMELRGIDVSSAVTDPHDWPERGGRTYAALEEETDPAPTPPRRSDPVPPKTETETKRRTPAPTPPPRKTTPPTPPRSGSTAGGTDAKKPTLDDLGLPKPGADRGRSGTKPASVVNTSGDRKPVSGPYAALEREEREVGDMTFKLKDERRQLNRLVSALRKVKREDSAFNRVNLDRTAEEYRAARCNQHTSVSSIQALARGGDANSLDERELREEENKLRDAIDRFVERRKSIVRLIMAKRQLAESNDPKAREAHDQALRKYNAAK